MDPLIRCPRCWKHVTEQARFCPRCGSALKAGNAAYITRQPEPPHPPERSGGGAATFLLFLLLSALGTAGMLVFGLTTRGPVMVRPAPPPVPALPAPSEWPAPDVQTDDSYRDLYRSEQADPAAPYPVPPQPRAYPHVPRMVYPPPPRPPVQPQIRQHRHEPRDDEWGR